MKCFENKNGHCIFDDDIVNSCIDKMVEANLLERSYGKEDRRSIFLSFTRKGLEMFKTAKKEKLKIACEMLSKLDAKEREQLLMLVKKMLNEK